MNKFIQKFGLWSVLVFVVTTASAATVITTNTAISPINPGYDGTDLVISNCTVTLDGPHSFNSLLIASGGVLTHSYLGSGSATVPVNAINEPQILDGYFPATLNHTNVQGLVTVTDTNGVTYSNGVDYIQTNLPDGTTQIYATTNSAIPAYANVLVSYIWEYNTTAGLFVTLTNDLTVATGGAINANGIGYGAGLGVGHGGSGGNPLVGNGAGHGGNGGFGGATNGLTGFCYDSLYQPVILGSGGGNSYAGAGGIGGGLVQITSGGNVNIYGLITANGNSATNSRAGGGAGGSIWIIATNFTGSGSVTANGGAGELPYGGGAGGGRISIQCVSNLFTGSLSATGGAGFQPGGAGTVFTQVAGTNGLLVMDNGGLTKTYSSVNLSNLADVIIRNGAMVQPSSSFLPNNLTIATNGTLSGNIEAAFTLNIPGSLWIQSGGSLTLDSQGYTPGTGNAPGSLYNSGGTPYPCGGGGHGGFGGFGFGPNGTTPGGSSFESQTAPVALGSGGGGNYYNNAIGGAGGGALQLTVAGTLQVDGRISANGGNAVGSAGGGGGSGGSIYIPNCGLLAGAGTITANGGTGVTALGGGGGGGGRIAIAAVTSTFSGFITAYGGVGVCCGGAGTIYTQFGISQPSLILDNGGNPGTNTTIATASTANLIVQNGARAYGNGVFTFNSLLVATNSWLTHPAAGSMALTISGNATLQAGGGFIGDSLGHAGNSGIDSGFGNGTSPYYPCSGGGYGGSGGISLSNMAAASATVVDSPSSPSSSYSGSGGGTYSPSLGGSGGGYFQLTANGTLQLDGLLSANGGNGSGPGGGGGAGGAIYLHAGTFSGAGAIAVNGGAGAAGVGGGGGGGRIAVYFNSNKFTGALSAFGGSGANYGGAGSIYFKTNSAANGQVIADNAGHSGGATFWSSSSSTDFTLRNGAVCFLSSSPSFGNIIVGSNSGLAVTNTFANFVAVNATSLTIQPGGIVSADAAGNFPGSGNGLGGSYSGAPYYQGGGGGHGGTGGWAVSNAAAGGTYFDSQSSPSLVGGAGGGYQSYSTGGRGGGGLNLTLSGPLQVDGSLSANGGNGGGVGGGGGAGGTLNLHCTGLRGSGSISANGGNGVANAGGGGGGGIIFANFTSNVFSGTLSAFGGGGTNYGGAGIIYFQTNFTGQTLLIADNGGHRGTNTPLASANNWIVRNGATAFAMNSSQSLNSLLVGSNSWLLASAIVGGSSLNLFVSGNATIQSGGGIFGDGYGNLQNIGTGHGFSYAVSPYYQCSGAGHGGDGASGPFNGAGGASGGTTYDSSSAPTTSGSGGGGYPNYSIGGNGGGFVRLSVSGTLLLNGTISVNGLTGTGIGGGGGSGGSIYLAGINNFSPGNVFTGSGTIFANGGSGAGSYGGGGGGGRIAVVNFNSNTFTGSISAVGGSGFAYGGAGTIYTKTSQQSYGQLLLDNGGNSGTNTTFDTTPVDATIQNNAIGSLPTTRFWSTHNIFLHTNGTLTAPVSSSLNTLVANNLTIDPGGRITLDGIGNTSQTGSGSGSPGITGSFGGGASHGGYGGGNRSGYGLAYDSILAPVMSGSGGGTYSPYSGGSGGGALQLTVNGTLTVNGRISANGTGGGYGTGGGSGGSLYFPYVNTFAGTGLISANGGSTNSAFVGNGGGGGRIAMYATNSTFTGLLSAHGGYGSLPGGAGTIFTSIAGYQNLTLDNGGLAGTNTPVATNFSLPKPPFDFNVSGDATASLLTSLPVINNLNIGSGSTLTAGTAPANLFLAVKNNFNLAGNLLADNLGYSQTNGPGTGGNLSQEGSGGGYGGIGGNAASGAPGGTNYGSASQPTDFGSGGGNGAQAGSTGSEGGGAIRLDVGGTLSLNGTLSANGDFSQQDNAGGGSGGSIWITANTLSGLGNLAAVGGNGDLYYGGGGGGGRIAIYSPSDLFTGTTNVNGGLGDNNGQPGTIFLSSSFLDFLATSQSPTGTVNNTVSSADVYFNDAVDPASVSAAAFTITTPAGAIDPSNVTASATSLTSVHLTFPLQNLLGTYTIQVAPVLTNVLGYPLASGFSGNFTISLPTISGTVTDTNSAPISGVLIQPDGGLIGSTTDSNGNYTIGVPPGWNGTLTPSYGTAMFVPGSLIFTNITTSVTNQNFLIVPTIAPALAASLSSTNLSFTWSGLSGVTYQIWSSPDLITWTPYGNPIPGLTGSMQVALPIDPTNTGLFYRLGASD